MKQHEQSSCATAPINIMPNAITAARSPPLSRSSSISELSIETTSGDSIPSTSPPFSASEMESIQHLQSNIVRVSSRKLEQSEPADSNVYTTGNEAENEDREGLSHDNISSSSSRHHLGHLLAIHHHFNPFQFHKDGLEEGSYECNLNIPIIVTSREEYRERGVPALPDYDTAADEPPSYRTALQNLPPVHIYPPNDELQNENSSL
ncbi:hypothetical protein [Parasitella parasitica]|uniref:Uncharacterized protein n=1 Tax=Parasitella parasitica TaxID=35722 RepID=A0A0B7NVT7_9FUNG|nr:hypothetical protein [Parasitella parasitica]